MIGLVSGVVIATASDKVLVEVGGTALGAAGGAARGTTGGTAGSIGYWVHVTPQTLATLMSATANSSNGYDLSSKNGSGHGSGSGKSKATARFYTEHVVREDANLLYGFLTAEEQMCFATLIGISGIGPQLALAVLATHSPADLQTLLLEGDIDSLCLVPGIGPKKARQLMATMKDRFAITDFQPADATVASSPRAEARQALSELGYSAEEIQAALADISSADSDISSADTETLVKAALSVLAK